jgi:type II secretory ATPase GspE/PulE/Tfp pilus assembly ATPase PilB-like protein
MASFIRIPDARNVELRFQSAPERYGVDVAIRVLNYDGKIGDRPDIAALGYLPDQIALLREYGHGPGGGVIFAGQTGSGKTTALNALVASHPDVRAGTAYAATLEDPPEGRPPNVSQFAVARSADRGGTGDDNPFVAGLRVRMRSDGDILIMGEIRDSATAEIFAQLGMSGHKVFASFHAGSCRGSYERLLSRLMGLSHEVVASADVIGLTVFQQLVPRLCPRCRVPARDAWNAPEERNRLARLEAMGVGAELLFVRNTQGCASCNRGRVGVQVVAELFAPDDAQRLLLAAGSIGAAFRTWRGKRDVDLLSATTRGKTAFEVALHFAASGVIGIDTVDGLVGRISTYEEPRTDG